MNEREFQKRLTDVMTQLREAPTDVQDELAAIAEGAKERHASMRKAVDELQETLDFLRLSVKYLVFDLEATRRENQFLRQLIENEPGSTDTNG